MSGFYFKFEIDPLLFLKASPSELGKIFRFRGIFVILELYEIKNDAHRFGGTNAQEL